MHRLRSFIEARRLSGLALSAGLFLGATAPLAAEGGAPFLPPVANPFEARIGSVIQPAPRKLRLDIGGRVDLVGWGTQAQPDDWWITTGAEFATWTRLRSENNLKFPVETADYWFGVYATARIPGSDVQLRMRVAHISSHVVDGLADTSATLQRKPFVYSREFVETLVALPIEQARIYAGVTWLFSTQPRDVERLMPQAGIDTRWPIGGPWAIHAGYDWKLLGIGGTWVPQQAAQAGVFVDAGGGRGLLVSLYARSGRDMHGMYYRNDDAYIGMGFQILW